MSVKTPDSVVFARDPEELCADSEGLEEVARRLADTVARLRKLREEADGPDKKSRRRKEAGPSLAEDVAASGC